MNVLLATPFHNALAWTQYVASMAVTIAVLERKKIKYDFFLVPSDTYVYRVRNIVANEFYNRKELTHLFFIDADMVWDAPSFLKVLERKEDFCGGDYSRKNNYGTSAAVPIGGKFETGKNGLVEVYTVPSGFCKISRAVFDTVAKRGETWMDGDKEKIDFYGHIKLADGHILGEDCSFCHRWREAHGKCWLIPGCNIGHIGYKVYELGKVN
jgi:hypothetical protein